MGGALSRYRRAEKYVKIFVSQKLKERNYLKDKGIDGRTILK
jgi:hypothetical protein